MSLPAHTHVAKFVLPHLVCTIRLMAQNTGAFVGARAALSARRGANLLSLRELGIARMDCPFGGREACVMLSMLAFDRVQLQTGTTWMLLRAIKDLFLSRGCFAADGDAPVGVPGSMKWEALQHHLISPLHYVLPCKPPPCWALQSVSVAPAGEDRRMVQTFT